MKKTLRILSILLVVLMLVSLTSCNRIKPGKLSDIAGVYKLEEYQRTYRYDNNWQEIPNYSENPIDMLSEHGIVCYVIISTDNNNYYVYKDNETPLVCYKASAEYVYETDDDGQPTNRISNINLKYTPADYKSLYVQADKHTFTDNSSAIRLKIFNTYTGTKYNERIRYKRVSKDTALSIVEKELGITLTPQDMFTVEQ